MAAGKAELSGRLRGMKFMRRKEDAADRGRARAASGVGAGAEHEQEQFWGQPAPAASGPREEGGDAGAASEGSGVLPFVVEDFVSPYAGAVGDGRRRYGVMKKEEKKKKEGEEGPDERGKGENPLSQQERALSKKRPPGAREDQRTGKKSKLGGRSFIKHKKPGGPPRQG